MKKTLLKKLMKGSCLMTALMLLSSGLFAGCSDGSSGGSDNNQTPAVTPLTDDEPYTDVTGSPVSTVMAESDENADIQIVMCGDSIMRTYEAADGDETGWGQVLQFFFDTGVYVNNTLSNGGRSSKSFYYEKGRWESVKSILSERTAAGKKTYVFINFGHNDQKYIGNGDTFMNYATFAKENPAGWTERTYDKESNVIDSYDPATAPDNGTYKDFIEKYITETKALGGTPVIFSPFVRCYSSDGVISDKGAHNLTEAYTHTKENEAAPRGNYPEAAEEAAEENDTVYIDLTALSKTYVESALALGKEKFVYWPNDTTHVCAAGALKIAELAVNGLKDKIPELSSHMITPDTRIMVNSNTLNFGSIYPENTTVKSFKISAFNAAGGKITVTAPKGYTVSLSESTGFAKSLEIDTPSGYFGNDVYVRFEPKGIQEYNYNLQITHSLTNPDFGNSPCGKAAGTILLIALTGAGKQKAAEGTDFTVTWPMIDSSKGVLYTANVEPEGVITAGTATLSSNLVASTAKADYVNKVYRSRFASSLEEGWPGSRSESLYLEYKVSSGSSTAFVNQITLNLASSGTGNMRWDVLYSTKDDFSSPVTIVQGGQGTAIDQDGATSAKANDVLTEVKSDSDMGLNITGKTLTVRVYPYMKSADTNGSGRLLMTGDIIIEGIVQ